MKILIALFSLITVVGAKRYGGYLTEMLKEPQLSREIENVLAKMKLKPYAPIQHTHWTMDYDDAGHEFTFQTNDDERATIDIASLTVVPDGGNYFKYTAKNIKFNYTGSYQAHVPFLGTSPTGGFVAWATEAQTEKDVYFTADYATGVLNGGDSSCMYPPPVDSSDATLTPGFPTPKATKNAKYGLIQDANPTMCWQIAYQLVENIIVAKFVDNQYWKALDQSKTDLVSGIIAATGKPVPIPDVQIPDEHWSATNMTVEVDLDPYADFNIQFTSPNQGQFQTNGLELKVKGLIVYNDNVKPWSFDVVINFTDYLTVTGDLSKPQTISVRVTSSTNTFTEDAFPQDLPYQFKQYVVGAVSDGFSLQFGAAAAESATAVLTHQASQAAGKRFAVPSKPPR